MNTGIVSINHHIQPGVCLTKVKSDALGVSTGCPSSHSLGGLCHSKNPGCDSLLNPESTSCLLGPSRKVRDISRLPKTSPDQCPLPCCLPVTPGSFPLHFAPGVPHSDQAHSLALVIHLFPRAHVSTMPSDTAAWPAFFTTSPHLLPSSTPGPCQYPLKPVLQEFTAREATDNMS